MSKINIENRKINLILGPGGAAGMAHLGVIKGLLEKDIEINEIIGVSIGAVMGWIYCIDADISVIDKFSDNFLSKYREFIKMSWNFLQIDSDKLKKYLLSLSNGYDYTFDELKIPLIIIATNAKTGEITFLHEGSVIDAVIASCTFPFVNSPYKLNDKFFLDGGMYFSHFKSLPAKLKSDYPYVMINIKTTNNLFQKVLKKVFQQIYAKDNYRKNSIIPPEHKEHSALTINYKSLKKVKQFDFHLAKESIKQGENLIFENIQIIENYISKFNNAETF